MNDIPIEFKKESKVRQSTSQGQTSAVLGLLSLSVRQILSSITCILLFMAKSSHSANPCSSFVQYHLVMDVGRMCCDELHLVWVSAHIVSLSWNSFPIHFFLNKNPDFINLLWSCHLLEYYNNIWRFHPMLHFMILWFIHSTLTTNISQGCR